MTLERLIDELVDDRSLDALARLTGSKNEEVLAGLIEGAGRLIGADRPDPSDDEILDSLRQHLIDCRATGLLVDALASPDENAQEFALGCLSQIGDLQAFEPMVKLLETGKPDMKAIAAEHLSLLTHYDFGDDPAKWRDWFSRRAQGLIEQAVEDREDVARRLKLQYRKNKNATTEESDDTYGGYDGDPRLR